MRSALFAIGVLAYPRAFRRRFGAEMHADHLRSGGSVIELIAAGLSERWSALVRLFWWPNHQPHLYAPTGRHFMFWDTLRSDVRHTIRLALKTPLVTSLTVLALALGIGATAAIFTVVNSVLVKPLPYRNAEELVVVWSDASRQGRPQNTLSPANFLDFQRMNQTLSGLEGYFSFVTPFKLMSDGPSEIVVGITVTPRLFELLGRSPLLGRPLADQPASFEVVLSHGFWQRRFGGDPHIIGRTLQIDTTPATVVGVMPEDFTFPYGSMLGPSGFTRATAIDLWAPMAFSGPLATTNRILTPQGQIVRGTHWLGAIGRMKPGVTIDHVQADLSTAARQMEQAYPETNAGWGATVVPVLEQTVGAIRRPLLLLLVGVAFVLIIAAVNVANLVLARSIARQKELAMRVALGAGRLRMIQQALTEGLFLSVTGGIAGLLLARWGVSALVALAPADLPRLHEVAPDARMLWITVGVALLTGIFVGLLPAVTATRVAPQAALQDNSRGSVGSAFRRRARATLVVAEIALAVTLTIGAGLLLRSFYALVSVNAGFEASQMLTWQMNLPARITTQDQRTAFYRDFLDRMEALPGVVSVGGTSRLPLGSTGLTTSVTVEGGAVPRADWPEVQFRRALGNYFQTMGIPVIKGRMFNESDGAAGAPVCIINQAMATTFFLGEDPIGRQIRNSDTGPAWTIIALVGDVKHGALDELPQPEMYVSTYQGSMVSPYIVMRTSGDASAMVDLVRAEARRLDRDLPLYTIQTMETVKSDSLAQRRFILILVALFGALALALAAIGVYGVMSLLVSERTQEVGVRLALGAHPSTVLKMLVGQALKLAGAGVGIGVVISLAVMPLLATQLYDVQPRDPLTMTGVPVVLMVVAMLAALVPARRAMKVNPVQALRYE
ncbi:MAG TPA: ABC transporter permease [Vicinamibacterales bacterium]|nr:ABC transporter permease [Vicinamibacterales bacterium]